MIRFSATVTCQYDSPFAPYPASRYAEAMDWVEKSGFDGAEVCISNYEGFDVRRLREDLDRRGLGCSTISTGQSRTLENISLTHDDAEARKKAVRRIAEHVDAAAILGSKVTVGLLRGLGDAKRTDELRKLLVENLKPCVEHAEKKGVVILVEPLNRYETALINDAEGALSLIDELGGSPSLGVLWDVFHANIEDPGFEKTVRLLGKRLRHVHLADSNRAFPGYGHLDFDAVYDLLKAAGYGDYLSFECFARPSAQAVIDGSAPFIAALRKR